MCANSQEVDKKAEEDGKDPYLALLEYRNTSLSGLQYSPAQLLMSRNFKSKLPTTSRLLQSKVVNAKPLLVNRELTQKIVL